MRCFGRMSVGSGTCFIRFASVSNRRYALDPRFPQGKASFEIASIQTGLCTAARSDESVSQMKHKATRCEIILKHPTSKTQLPRMRMVLTHNSTQQNEYPKQA